ncbi:hypothetical protein Goari_001292 [Gossypium aridum]|uniref:Uncharacterized protein n=1 Tax=Gossypium aridum TaxID=34290 RepID=A0A7J8YK81_GOSAI|nr:hypothetical protein [Gossypium aridum]
MQSDLVPDRSARCHRL